ncbi:MAG: hypothetical protein ACKVQA_13880 [Burkholderiales bacterium]
MSDILEAGLSTINPTSVRAYLLGRGWQQIDAPSDRPWSLWQSPVLADSTPSLEEAFVPHDQQLRDYPRRLREVVGVLELVEHRSAEFIMRDMRLAGFDIIRIRLYSDGQTYDGILPIDDAAEAVAEARDMMLAGACAAVHPRMFYPSRKPVKATDYMKRVRLGQTEPGSFVFNVLSPVAPELRTSSQGEFAQEVPFERTVTSTLQTAVTAVVAAAVRAGATQELQPFEDAIASGVSANLCDALAGLSLGKINERNVDIVFNWASTRVTTPTMSKVSLGQAAATIIRAAAGELKAKAPEEDFVLTGPVVKTSREPGKREGDVTIRALVAGGVRSVRFTADEQMFDLATKALNDRKYLGAVGTLIKDGRSLMLQGAADVRIVEDNESLLL